MQTLAALAALGPDLVSTPELVAATGSSPAAVKRTLARLVAQGDLQVQGKARATRYRVVSRFPGEPGRFDKSARVLASDHTSQTPWLHFAPVTATRTMEPAPYAGPSWSAASLALRQRLERAVTARDPVSYRREFVQAYQANRTFLLPYELAEELAQLSRLDEQLPVGTFARKVLEPLLIDLSWSSSRLEGNRYSRLDTQELFESGRTGDDMDAVMLLNHKAAIEFLLDAVPAHGLHASVLANLHTLLMQDLLRDDDALGTIRHQWVSITGSTYVPLQSPQVLQEFFQRIVDLARDIRNPVEGAFFLWVNLAYLQPFLDGNKRVSRLAANIPLMLWNHAPLSFLEVTREDYAFAMMGVYEFCDLSMAIDLFDWTYRRSLARYQAVLAAAGPTDPFRIKHRERFSHAMQAIVRDRRTLPEAVAGLHLDTQDVTTFQERLARELNRFGVFNCARYRISVSDAQAWIDAGRPG